MISAPQRGTTVCIGDSPLPQNWQARKVDDWLLAVLRFAITLNEADRVAVLALADEMDRLGFVAERPAFGFFLRASTALCRAIVAKDDPSRAPVLRRHLARIKEPRLKRAFAAALDLETQPRNAQSRARRGNRNEISVKSRTAKKSDMVR
jgi:hypothetical protein